MIVVGHLDMVEMPHERIAPGTELLFPDTFRKTLDKLYNPRHVPAIPLDVVITPNEVWVISKLGHNPVQGNLWVPE